MAPAYSVPYKINLAQELLNCLYLWEDKETAFALLDLFRCASLLPVANFFKGGDALHLVTDMYAPLVGGGAFTEELAFIRKHSQNPDSVNFLRPGAEAIATRLAELDVVANKALADKQASLASHTESYLRVGEDPVAY